MAIEISDSLNGSVLVLGRHHQLTATIGGTSLAGSNLFMACKRNRFDPDEKALIKSSPSNGITVVASSTQIQATITFNPEDFTDSPLEVGYTSELAEIFYGFTLQTLEGRLHEDPNMQGSFFLKVPPLRSLQ